MSHHPRWIMTPGASRKRKEREAFYSHNNNPAATAQPLPATKAAAAALPVCSNRLLAGYMAYEFLTKGTLFGQRYDSARAGAVPLAGGASADLRKVKPEAEPSPKKEHQSYAEVANILKSKEAHIPGIVNPAQLARWIQM